jgi:hypothetical protein
MAQLAFVLFAAAPKVNPALIVEAINQRHPIRRARVEPQVKDLSCLSVDGELVLFRVMPEPFPPSTEFGGLNPFSRRGWDGKPENPEANTAHILLATHSEQDNREAAMALTLVVEAMAATGPCVGIYWNDSGLLVHPSMMAGYAKATDGGPPPLALWVNAVPWSTENGLRVYTEGLATFVGRELDFPADKRFKLEDIFNRAMNIANYLHPRPARRPQDPHHRPRRPGPPPDRIHPARDRHVEGVIVTAALARPRSPAPSRPLSPAT